MKTKADCQKRKWRIDNHSLYADSVVFVRRLCAKLTCNDWGKLKLQSSNFHQLSKKDASPNDVFVHMCCNDVKIGNAKVVTKLDFFCCIHKLLCVVTTLLINGI